MSNWATMKHQLLRDSHIDSTASGSLVDTDISRAIIESILFNRGYNLGWNNAEYSFNTENNVQSYDMPLDYLRLTSDVFFSSINDDDIPYGKRPLRNRPMSWIRESVTNAVSDSTSIHYDTGITTAYGIDPVTRKMFLSPVPTGGPWYIDYSYMRDPGTPSFKSDGTTWTIYSPNTEDAIASTYTNDWFDVGKGYHLIMNRALYILSTRGYGGNEEMAGIGANAVRMWAEELNRLRAEAARHVSVTVLRKHI